MNMEENPILSISPANADIEAPQSTITKYIRCTNTIRFSKVSWEIWRKHHLLNPVLKNQLSSECIHRKKFAAVAHIPDQQQDCILFYFVATHAHCGFHDEPP